MTFEDYFTIGIIVVGYAFLCYLCYNDYKAQTTKKL